MNVLDKKKYKAKYVIYAEFLQIGFMKRLIRLSTAINNRMICDSHMFDAIPLLKFIELCAQPKFAIVKDMPYSKRKRFVTKKKSYAIEATLKEKLPTVHDFLIKKTDTKAEYHSILRRPIRLFKTFKEEDFVDELFITERSPDNDNGTQCAKPCIPQKEI